jgi:hypothetical protein
MSGENQYDYEVGFRHEVDSLPLHDGLGQESRVIRNSKIL